MAAEIMASFVLANNFMFCKHGYEYCGHCGCDHAYVNDNFLTMDLSALEARLSEYGNTAGLLPREPLSIAGQFTTINKESGPNGAACKAHSREDCQDCFNWDKIIREQLMKKLTGKVSKSEASKAKLDDRGRIIGLLRSMGVTFPEQTKLPTNTLEKRLDVALNCAQFASNYSAKFPLNFGKYPTWKGKSIFDGVRRGNGVEALEADRTRSEGRGREPPALYVNAFTDLRQTVLNLAKHCDDGITVHIFENHEQTECIAVRILSVQALDDKTPVFSLIYALGSSQSSSDDVINFVCARMRGKIMRTYCTAEEQAMLRKILFMNSERVSSDFRPKLEPYERNFKISFLLPVGPLSQIDIGKLTSDTGCAICGKKTTSRCTGCLSVSYCGQACQKAHWKEHKGFCRTIRGGKWTSVKFTTQLQTPEGEPLFVTSINFSSSTPTPICGPGIPVVTPPNVHGDNAFLVKIQRPGSVVARDDDTAAMMVYDRNRSFQGYITPRENPGGYAQVLSLLAGGRAKIYRWAKRTDDWVLNVCLDRAPATNPPW
ncbi:hypothetical protein FB107DRAFT_207452 [Schizophyllum commune]